MKKLAVTLIISLFLASCGPLQRLHQSALPVKYDNVMISVTADNVLFFPPMQDKEFMKIVTSRLTDSTKSEVASQGNYKLVSSCGPRTIKLTQEITGLTANTVTNVRTGFFLFQIFSGSATSTKGDIIYIDTDTKVIDCESGNTLNTYKYQNYGINPLEIIQGIAFYNVWYAYSHQRGEQ